MKIPRVVKVAGKWVLAEYLRRLREVRKERGR